MADQHVQATAQALEVLDPGIYGAAWRVGAPVVKLTWAKP